VDEGRDRRQPVTELVDVGQNKVANKTERKKYDGGTEAGNETHT